MSDASAPSPATLFARLLVISREAHRDGHHEAAYHALTAAMHAADDASDAPALAEIGLEAEAQIAWIDQHAPGSRISTRSARQHDHPGVYAMLARQVAAHASRHAPRSTPALGRINHPGG